MPDPKPYPTNHPSPHLPDARELAFSALLLHEKALNGNRDARLALDHMWDVAQEIRVNSHHARELRVAFPDIFLES